MTKFKTPAKTRENVSRKLHLINRKKDVESENEIATGMENYSIIKEVIEKYMEKYKVDGKKLIRPGLNSSSVENNRICLRTGNVLLAIFDNSTEKFVPLTRKLIWKYSKE